MATELIAGDNVSEAQFLGGNDGTFILRTGPDGAKVTVFTADSAGKITFAKQPTVPAASMVRVTGNSGYGSTNTKIVRWSTLVSSQGTDITYTDSATLGGSFTINTSGVYSFTGNTSFSAGAQTGLSLNTTQPTVSINLLTASEILDTGVYTYAPIKWIGYLAAGSVVRVHTDGGTLISSTASPLTVTRVA